MGAAMIAAIRRAVQAVRPACQADLKVRTTICQGLLVAAMLLACSSSSFAGERYAVIITGASGGDAYAQKYTAWRVSFTTTLREKFHYAPDRLIVLAETEGDGVQKATREHVRRALTDVRARMTKNDQLVVLLIGHGTSIDGDEAKFNLVGPDMSASEWADVIRPIPGRVVFVNTTAASFPFLRKLAGRGRIVLTATDAAAQQFETVFAEFFVKAFDDPAANFDKNGRVSIWRPSPTPAPPSGSRSNKRGSSRPSGRCSTIRAPASGAKRRIPAPTVRWRALRIWSRTRRSRCPPIRRKPRSCGGARSWKPSSRS